VEPCPRRSTDGVFARTALISVALALFFGLSQLASARPLLDFAGDTGQPSAPGNTGARGHGMLTGSIAQTDQTWTCRGPVDLDSVSVTMTSAITTRRGGDAVHLEPGCTGHIGRLEVVTSVADGVKVAEGVHDLGVDGGSIRCVGKVADVHQDGMQVMGGARITLRGLRIDCGRPQDALINSNLFIKRSGRSVNPPTDVVCVDCSLGGSAAHTASIQESVRSGLVDSRLCAAKYSKLTLSIGANAVDPVDVGNAIDAC
jgi:hypothetical protein